MAKPKLTETPELLTVNEAAQYLRIGRVSLYKLLKTTKLKRVRLGGTTLFRRTDLERFIESCIGD